MVRKKNGWVVEELVLTETDTMLKQLGDWDVRGITEGKALAALIRAAY